MHHDVLHGGEGATAGAEGREVAHEHAPIPVDLHRRERQEDGRLRLGRQPLFDVRLETTEQAALQQPVQLAHQTWVDCSQLRIDGGVEELGRREDIGEQKVEQRPQLMQVVLDRRTGQEQTALRGQLAQDHREARVLIFESVRFVDNEAAPLHLLERCRLRAHRLVRRETHVVLALAQSLNLQGPLVLGAVQLEHAQ